MNKNSLFIIGLIITAYIIGCDDKKSVDTLTKQKIETSQPAKSPEKPEISDNQKEPPVTTQNDEKPVETGIKPEKTTSTADSLPKTQQTEVKPEPKTADTSYQQQKTVEKPEEKVEKPVIIAEKPEYFEDCEIVFTNYVDKSGNVDYKTLRRKRADLIRAAREFSNVHPAKYLQWSKSEKTAFWINAYNIFTLKIVIDNYPIKPHPLKIIYPRNSIIHISDPWNKEYFDVMGIQYTLREIEREIVLQKFKDPRTCFAFSYSTMGGAFLRNEPYSAEKLEQQLDDQVRKFVNSPRGLRIDQNNKIIKLSDIFNWYKKDFIAKYGDMKKFRDRSEPIQAYFNFMEKYLSEEEVRCLESSDYTVEFLKYDWQLNEKTTN